jgi:hypothetical protein
LTVLAMNAPLRPEILLSPASRPFGEAPSGAPITQCHVWQSRFGTIVIELRSGRIYVNGGLVEPADGSAPFSPGAA